VAIDPADYDSNILSCSCTDTGDDPADEDAGHCLASRVDGVWKFGDGLDPATEGPGYVRVTIHRK
jgi:hypothetical protein